MRKLTWTPTTIRPAWRPAPCTPTARYAGRHLTGQGFTLIEMLVALAVLAATGLALSSAVGNVALQTWGLERRAVAHWVAENQLARAQLLRLNNQAPLQAGRNTETVVLGGRRWRVRENLVATSHPGLCRVEIEVFELVDGAEVGPLDRLVGFVGRY